MTTKKVTVSDTAWTLAVNASTDGLGGVLIQRMANTAPIAILQATSLPDPSVLTTDLGIIYGCPKDELEPIELEERTAGVNVYMRSVRPGVSVNVAVTIGAPPGVAADGANAAVGSTADAAYAGSGASTLIAALKGIYAKLASIGVSDGGDVAQGAKADAAYAGSGAASIIAILKGLYTAMIAATPTGGNQIGYIFHTTNVSAMGGVFSKFRLLSSAASTNATSIKASATRLYYLQLYNNSAAVKYLKLYNKASAPTVGTDTPVETYALKPNDYFILSAGDIGDWFVTGLAMALTGGEADADTTAVASGDIKTIVALYT